MATPTTYFNLLKPLVGETYDVNLTNNNMDKIDTQLNVQSKAGNGLIKSAYRTSSTANQTDFIVDFLSPVTFKAGRKYVIEWDTSYACSDTATLAYFTIGTAATTDAGGITTGITVINGRTKGAYIANSTLHTGPIRAYYEPTVDSTVQIKFRMQRVAGTGTISINCTSGEQGSYTVIDLGAQF